MNNHYTIKIHIFTNSIYHEKHKKIFSSGNVSYWKYCYRKCQKGTVDYA